MIKTIEINYKAKNGVNDYYYLREDENVNKRELLPKKIEFTPGLNLVIGGNGCGKTTLVDIITKLTLARGGLNNEYTFWDDVKIFIPIHQGLTLLISRRICSELSMIMMLPFIEWMTPV